VLLAFVALFDLELEQLVVKTAFLYRKLEEEIYMRQLEGFVVPKLPFEEVSIRPKAGTD